MGCMKCGRDVSEGAVFCESCIATMDRYPVEITAPVQIPSRKSADASPRRYVRRKISSEEQVRRLRRYNRVLSFLLALALMAAIFFGYIAVNHFMEEERFLPGQNYSTMDPLSD